MVGNKSKTSLIRHMQKKYMTHIDKQYNICAVLSYNIVIFIHDTFFLYMSFGKLSHCVNSHFSHRYCDRHPIHFHWV